MTKYIVYWVWLKMVSVSCPSNNNPDVFGRSPLLQAQCAVLHLATERVMNKRWFTNKDSVVLFIDRLKKESDIDSVRIDTIHFFK
jgi:hypothetical protein